MNYKDAYLYLFTRITDLQEALQKLQIIAEAIVTETDSEEETTEEEEKSKATLIGWLLYY